MEHVGIVVDDLPAATEFFVELGLELQGEGSVEGRWVDRVVGLDGVRVEYAMVQTPDGHGRLELIKFHSPSTRGGNRHEPANTPGIRHVAFAVENIDAVVAGLRARGAELVGELERYEDSYRLCYVRSPEGIIIELAEQIGWVIWNGVCQGTRLVDRSMTGWLWGCARDSWRTVTTTEPGDLVELYTH
jgi:catechol 2,3-dioxygenase-like lactoylglutathione lyase family enzyme